jgi:hypothetical protein
MALLPQVTRASSDTGAATTLRLTRFELSASVAFSATLARKLAGL